MVNHKTLIKSIDSWGNKEPKILWQLDLGEGHAAPAIYNGKVYLLDYIEDKKILKTMPLSNTMQSSSKKIPIIDKDNNLFMFYFLYIFIYHLYHINFSYKIYQGLDLLLSYTQPPIINNC